MCCSLFFHPPAWWCSWPETCRLTSTPTSLISSSSSPRCWTQRTQSSWSGLLLLSHTFTSTCGGSWWKTWATSTSKIKCSTPWFTSQSASPSARYENSLLFTLHSLYSTLLAHKKEHIRKFAAESFSFLMRKVSYLHSSRQQDRRALFPHLVLQSVSPCVKQVPDIDSLLSHVFLDLQQHPEKAEGAGQLLFEMCKGVRNMFHSCAEKVSFFLFLPQSLSLQL